MIFAPHDMIFITHTHCNIFVFLCLTLSDLLYLIARSIYDAANGIISFFVWLNSIPLYICTKSSLSIPLSMDIFRLLPCMGYCKQCCNEYWGAISFQSVFFSGYKPKSEIVVYIQTSSYYKDNNHFRLGSILLTSF